jgi:sulfate transport system substrate-binding protein
VSGAGPARECARGRGWAAAAIAALLAAAACASAPDVRSERVRIVFASYTTPREAYEAAVIPAFRAYWRQKTGQEVTFESSYRPSGLQAGAIGRGLEADVAALSLAGDLDRLVEEGLVRHNWQAVGRGGIVTRSLVVIAVPRGNPADVRDWPDLARPGVRLLTPDPRTSGGGRWNVAAAYGAALRGRAGVRGFDAAAAEAYLVAVLRNVGTMDRGARESVERFAQGGADAALTYEHEALALARAGEPVEYVIPSSTLLVENPVAVVDRHADRHGVREVADAFVAFLWSAEAQRAFAAVGLRPVDDAVARETEGQFGPAGEVWSVGYLGGWGRVGADLFGADGTFNRALAAAHPSE